MNPEQIKSKIAELAKQAIPMLQAEVNKKKAEKASNSPVDVSKLSDQPKVAVAQPSPLSNIPSFESILNRTNAPSQLQNAQGQLVSNLLRSNATLAGKEDFRSEQEKALDIAGKTQAANAAVSAFQQAQLQQANIPMVIQEEAAGQGQTRFTTSVRESDAQRQLAIRQNINAANILATQGDLTTARGIVDDAVNSKYEALERENALQQQNLQLLSPLVSQERQDRINEQQLMLQERARLLTDFKEREKTLENFAMNVLANGGTQEQANQVRQLENPSDAFAMFGDTVIDPQIKMQKQQLLETIKNNAFTQNLQTKQFNLSVQQLAATRAAAFQAARVAEGTRIDTEKRAGDAVVAGVDEKLALINKLLTNAEGFNAATGLLKDVVSLRGEKGDWESAIQALISKETFAELADITANTSLGAISEGELNLVAKGATMLQNYKTMSEGEVLSVLASMQDNLLSAKQKAYQNTLSTGEVSDAYSTWTSN